MQIGVLVLVLLGAAWINIRPLRAQQTPTAVIVDPAADKQFPPGLSILTIPSNGSEMDANVATYRTDPRRLVIIGHSFGGLLAGYVERWSSWLCG